MNDRITIICEVDPKFVRRTAHIFGECSASAKALAEYELRQNAGENDVAIFDVAYRQQRWLLVGPKP